jgi:hypothetical protein
MLLIDLINDKIDLSRESFIDNLRDSLNSFRIDFAIRFDLSFDLWILLEHYRWFYIFV